MEEIKHSLPEVIPEVIFLDINMPVLNGFQFLDEFEKFLQELKSKIRIVILTSSINPNHVEKSKTYKGVVDYYDKPLLVKDLNNLFPSEVTVPTIKMDESNPSDINYVLKI